MGVKWYLVVGIFLITSEGEHRFQTLIVHSGSLLCELPVYILCLHFIELFLFSFMICLYVYSRS